MTDVETLSGTLDRVWEGLSAGRGPWRLPVLATRSVGGGASARVVVLRGAVRTAARLEIWTHAQSGKIAELRRDPRAEALIWDGAASFQVRLSLQVDLVFGDAATWATLDDAAKRDYATDPAPGTVLDDPHVAPRPDPDLFVRLDARVTAIETLHLGADLHRRARFAADDGFAGRWIAP